MDFVDSILNLNVMGGQGVGACLGKTTLDFETIVYHILVLLGMTYHWSFINMI